MNNIWVLGLVFILCLIAGIVTFSAVKDMERQQKKQKENPDSLKEAIKRSSEYEKTSWGTMSPLTWMYVVAIVVSLVAFLIYVF